jgi:N-acetylmuramoyl-L-alanine amidase
MFIRLIIFLFLSLTISNSFAAQLFSVALQQEASKAIIKFDIDNTVAHKVFSLSDPNRVVVDFIDTHSTANLNNIKINFPWIKQIRGGYVNAYTFRVVIDLANEITFKVMPWENNQYHRRDFNLIIFSMQKSMPDNKPSPFRRINYTKRPSAYTSPQVLQHKSKAKTWTVVLDPGHGGKDPGAMGPGRIREKDVTLAIAKRLQATINSQPNMRAILTRNNDRYVGLRGRLAIARQYDADVFISIHADAFINSHSSGASVYALSQRGATSEAARWLAEKENYSELGGVNLNNLNDANGMVRTVLLDLSQTATITDSLQLGKYVLNNIHHMGKLHYKKVEQARFMVLKSPDIPSILVETGFISNPIEAQNLNTASYQAKLAVAITQGLQAYLKQRSFLDS